MTNGATIRPPTLRPQTVSPDAKARFVVKYCCTITILGVIVRLSPTPEKIIMVKNHYTYRLVIDVISRRTYKDTPKGIT